MLIIIDNYDSFTYNLVHQMAHCGEIHSPNDIKIIRNDALSVDQVLALNPRAIIISPGPATPDQAGICIPLIQAAAKRGDLPVLGVCLGHQALGAAFGAKIIRTPPLHGKITPINHQNTALFRHIPNPVAVTRYHSLIIDKQSLPDQFIIDASVNNPDNAAKDGLIMAMHHRSLPLYGVQFHPESIATQHGNQMIKNFFGLIAMQAV
ncbi:MAG: aminodeoxychorismate/anthranilate synthase component II [Alphaproteobacteria bacterium]